MTNENVIDLNESDNSKLLIGDITEECVKQEMEVEEIAEYVELRNLSEFTKPKNLGEYTESKSFSKVLNKYIANNNEDIFIICIGTDRVSGDSFGPFVGTFLTNLGYKNVLGTIDNPVHALNLEENIIKLPKDKIVIAIDAVFGDEYSTGSLFLKSGQIRAGSGVGKSLTPVGDFSIKGVVVKNSGDSEINGLLLSTVRLSTVIKMAEQCAETLSLAFPLKHKTPKVKSKF